MRKLRNLVSKGRAWVESVQKQWTRLVVTGMAFWASEANASSGGGLPWDQPLTTLANDLTGPVALSISVIAFAVTGFMMIWGGEMTDFMKTMVRIIFAISVVTGGTGLYTKFFGGSGAAF
jgi:type IV secretory pathway VirB2 component (pilin)